jgi:myo-inositol 2-dehydrogenase/D-chiro-inositol 1-dehydrogenase
MSVLRIGLLGAGRIGRVHAINIAGHARSELVAVSDVNEEAAQSLASSYGAKALSSEAILKDTSIDAVLIATSTDTHSDLIEEAARAGKAVLCEKPVDLSLQRPGHAWRWLRPPAFRS